MHLFQKIGAFEQKTAIFLLPAPPGKIYPTLKNSSFIHFLVLHLTSILEPPEVAYPQIEVLWFEEQFSEGTFILLQFWLLD